MKKILLSLFGIITLGLINFSNATNYTCSDVFIDVSENSYFILNSIDGDGYFILDYEGGYLGYGIAYPEINLEPNGNLASTFPIILNPGTYTLSCTSLDSLSFSIVPAITSCPSCPSCPTLSGSCTVSDKINENIIFSGSKSFSNAGYTNVFNYGTEGAGTYCIKFTSSNPQTLTMGFANGGTTAPTNLYSLYNDQYGNTICLYGNKPYLNVKLNSSSNTIDYEVYKLADLLNDDIPCQEDLSCESDLTTCQGNLTTCQGMYDRLDSDYDLLEGNYNTCTSELSSCLQNGGSSGSGDIQWSSLFINNIQHLGNENIFITIPEYLKFSYTNTGDDFELDIVGLEQDEEYLSGVINKSNYIPTSEDLSNVFSNLGLFGSLLVVCLFIILVFYMIKKIFN